MKDWLRSRYRAWEEWFVRNDPVIYNLHEAARLRDRIKALEARLTDLEDRVTENGG